MEDVMKKVILAGIAVLFIGIVLSISDLHSGDGSVTEKEEPVPTFGLFSWDAWVTEQEEAETLSLCMQETAVSEIYQEFPAEMLETGSAAPFVARMRGADVDVYSLVGAAEWALEGNDGLLEAVRTVTEYNQSSQSEEQIVGIMIDVEPHVLSQWSWKQEELVEGYVQNLREAYIYANTHDLNVLVCITNGYDEYCPEALEAILSQACDGIAIMNYDRTDEYGQIKDEVSLAREYGKRVICIYELQKPGYHGLETINTYAEEGLDALHASMELLEEQFAPFDLDFAYHYYAPLKEMLGLEER